MFPKISGGDWLVVEDGFDPARANFWETVLTVGNGYQGTRASLEEGHKGELPATYDIVGPVCETGDTFARGRDMTPLSAGDLVAFRSAGAYGAVMSSEYNSRPLIPEVLVRGDQFAVIRARPSLEEMLERDSIPVWL